MMRKTAVSCILFSLFLWCAAASSFTVDRGGFRLVIYDDAGTFSLYYLTDPEKKLYEPVLSDLGMSKTTAFSLRIDNKTVKLQRNFGMKISAEPTDSGARIVYDAGSSVRAVLDFTFLSSVPGMPADMLRLGLSVTNTQARSSEIAVKAVFGTILGEAEGIHFSTASRDRISSEILLSPGDEKWVLSAGKRASLRFVPETEGYAAPEVIAAANRERLTEASWMPPVTPGRNFNATYSINDSALGFFWPERIVPPDGTLSVLLYLTASSGKYLPPVPAGGRNLPEPEISAVPENSADVISLPSGENAGDTAYIQAILSRIREIEADPSSADRDEIQRLNRELDLILERLGG